LPARVVLAELNRRADSRKRRKSSFALPLSDARA
jgi:hypothetical protein